MIAGTTIVPLEPNRDLEGFDCGDADLNGWLAMRAHAAESGRTARTYLMLLEDQIIGYASLAAGSVERSWLPGRARRNTPDPVPSIFLARLAIDRDLQRQGAGHALIADMFRRCLRASELIGARLLLGHLLGDEAVGFYAGLGFAPVPQARGVMFRILGDIDESLLTG